MNKASEKKDGEDGLPIPPYKLYNIGNNHPENLLDFVNILSEELINAGVLPKDFGYKPSTSLRDDLRQFAKWYLKCSMNKGC